MRSHPCSTGTCGSSRPREWPRLISRPWRPISTCSGRTGCGGESTLRETCSSGAWSRVTGRKTRVVKSRAACAFRHRAVKRRDGKHVTDTAPQVTAVIKSGEGAARLGQVRGRRNQRYFPLLQGCGNGLMRQSKQQAAFFGRKFVRQRGAGDAGQARGSAHQVTGTSRFLRRLRTKARRRRLTTWRSIFDQNATK